MYALRAIARIARPSSPWLGLVACTLLASTSPVAAAPLGGDEIRSRSTGGEFRGYGATRRAQLEDMIWRLRPDGTAVSTSQIRRGGRDSGQFIEYRDSGTWRVEANRLCVDFGSVLRDLSGCYGVDGIGGDHVRMIGPVQLEGTLGR